MRVMGTPSTLATTGSDSTGRVASGDGVLVAAGFVGLGMGSGLGR
jgi:hypothetical protein